jgi:Rrf2 family nitric oxide-sensitive transcriptional repressor
MIPKTAEYALRAVIVLARAPGQAYSAEQIAEATHLPRRYAHKVLQALVRKNLVGSQSGPGGAYSLLPAPEELSILDVVTAVEPIPGIRHCPLGLKSHTRLCPLHRELDGAYAAVEAAFGRVTIAQLLAQPDAVPPLCELGQAVASPADSGRRHGDDDHDPDPSRPARAREQKRR